MQRIRSPSDDQLDKFCTRSLATDSVELAFSEVNASVSYKATAQKVLLHLLQIDICTFFKQNPVYPFVACARCVMSEAIPSSMPK